MHTDKYVDLGADHPWLSETLFVLFGLANGWAEAAAKTVREGDRRGSSILGGGVSGFIALADDNFYPVTLTDLRLAREQHNMEKVESLTQIRNERFR
jgi:hypothetical protein